MPVQLPDLNFLTLVTLRPTLIPLQLVIILLVLPLLFMSNLD